MCAGRPTLPGLAPPALTARHGRVALVENTGGVAVFIAVRRVRAGWHAVVGTTHVRAIAFSMMPRSIGACCAQVRAIAFSIMPLVVMSPRVNFCASYALPRPVPRVHKFRAALLRPNHAAGERARRRLALLQRQL